MNAKRKTATSRDACYTCGEPTGGPWPVCSEECWWLLEMEEQLASEDPALPGTSRDAIGHGEGNGGDPRPQRR